MKYYIIAGEASGDMHGAKLMEAIRESDSEAEFRVWGGDRMEAAGGALVKHFRELAFMGFWEVLLNIRTILRNLRFCRRDIESYAPDALILIDYPGFNLRIARWAGKFAFPVYYYISPQIWAWNVGRVEQIRRSVDRMFVILPFEKVFYEKYDVEVDFVGHPLLDVIADFRPDPDFRTNNELDDRPIIALLPGSRRQEIGRLLPLMLEATADMNEYQVVVAGAPSIETEFYQPFLQSHPGTPRLIQEQTYQLLTHAAAGLVTSGTATLETALFDLPQVVCYRGSRLSYLIARRLVQVDYISLVNLIADRKLVEELIQDDCNPQRIREELNRLLDPQQAARMRTDYAELRDRLGQPGASARAGTLMVEYLQE